MIALLAAFLQVQSGVGYVAGFVRDSEGSDMSDVLIQVAGVSQGVDAGRFSLAVPAGQYMLRTRSMTYQSFVSTPFTVRAGDTTFVDTIVLRLWAPRTVYLGCAPSVVPAGATCAQGRGVGGISPKETGAWVIHDRKALDPKVARLVDWKHEMVVIVNPSLSSMTYVEDLPDLSLNRVLYTRDTVTVVLGADTVIARHVGHSGAEGIIVSGATAIPKSDAVVVFQYLQGRP